MRLKVLSGAILLLVFLSIVTGVGAKWYRDNEPRLYFPSNIMDENSLSFERTDYGDYSSPRAQIDVHSNETVTLSISGIEDRVYDEDLNFDFIISSHSASTYPVSYNFTIRCDGEGDGIFEYIVYFEEAEWFNKYSRNIRISSYFGEPRDMTNGVIEFIIHRTDNNDGVYIFLCWGTYLEVPFDIDIDSDGIGAYSDPDNDNDGYDDEDDEFPNDAKEWKDTDSDGIGDNSDPDHNGNGILDDYELPLAVGVLLIPLVVIYIQLSRIKKKKSKSKKEEGEKAASSLRSKK